MNRYRSYMNRIHAPSGLRQRVLEAAERGQHPRRPAMSRWAEAGLLAACFAAAFFGGWQAWQYAAHYQPDPTAGVADPPAVTAPAETEHTLVVEDPFGGQPHGFFDVPALEFADCTNSSPYLIDWAWKGDAFQEALSAEEIIATLGGADEVPWSLLWSGFGLDGTAWYGGENLDGPQVLMAAITGVSGDTSFTLELSPEQLPPGGVSYPDAAVQDCNGVSVTAWYTRPDGGENYTYCAEFMDGDTGVSFTCISPDQETASWLTSVLVRYAAQEYGGFTTEHLVPDEIPAAGEELTLADVRDNALNSWLPPADALPAGFTFEGGREEQNWGELSLLSAVWNRGEDCIAVTVRRSAGDGDYPEADLVLEDVTAIALQGLGRQYAGDGALWQWNSLAVDWGDGVLVEYSLRGLTLDEALGLIWGTPGRASTSIAEFPAKEGEPWTVPIPSPSPWQVLPLQ